MVNRPCPRALVHDFLLIRARGTPAATPSCGDTPGSIVVNDVMHSPSCEDL